MLGRHASISATINERRHLFMALLSRPCEDKLRKVG
jgi:hypothetical protein